MSRWTVGQAGVGTHHELLRLVEGRDVVVGWLDPRYSREVVDVLNGVPIGQLTKQVSVMSDVVEDILARVTQLARERR